MLTHTEKYNVNGSGTFPLYHTTSKGLARTDKVLIWAMLSLLAVGVAIVVTRSDAVHTQVDRLRARMSHSDQDRAAIHRVIGQ